MIYTQDSMTDCEDALKTITLKTTRFHLTPENNDRLRELCGNSDVHLQIIESHLAIEINHRGHDFKIIGPYDKVILGENLIQQLYEETSSDSLSEHSVNMAAQALINHKKPSQINAQDKNNAPLIQLKNAQVKARGDNQRRLIERIRQFDINFAVGVAGTGKTFLAIACAVDALEKGIVQRLVLVRPAVEAGENLGFLPGDLSQKIDPYLRPMYDALYILMGAETVNKLIERQVIEIAPLAYMRGRTLNDAFIILDESQNTTTEQMKMFLTRIGFNSKTVVTGDITQIDLPRGKKSGLRHAIQVLSEVEDLSFTFFESIDVIRHPLVQKIICAYDAVDQKNADDH